MTDMNIQSKLAEYEGVIRMLTAKIEELVAENERLSSALTAHQTLKMIYADSSQPAGVRVRAAQAALPHEVPRLAPVQAPLDVTCEEVVPLAQLVHERRARQDLLCPESAEKALVLVPVAPRAATTGNGNGDDRD